MTIAAVLFDMDGVLIDSEPAHFAVTREVLLSAGLPAPDDADWEATFFGRPDRDGFHDWFRHHALDADVPALMEAKAQRMLAVFPTLVTPFEDGQWLARQLHARGVRVALVTGARRGEVELVLDRFALRDVFAATISADEIATGKPDPGPYLAGAAALGVPPEDCAVIEDAVPGMLAGLAAGGQVIVVDRLARPERFAPLTPVSRLDERVLAQLTRVATC